MKTKLTITVEKNVIAEAKRAARGQKTSVSRIVENHLKDVTSGRISSFSSRWKGRFKLKQDGSPRMDFLLKHHQNRRSS